MRDRPAAREDELPGPSLRTRGYLPHFDDTGRVQMITFRLADALPQTVAEAWLRELTASPRAARMEHDPGVAHSLRRRAERYVDAGHGHCWLRDPRVATLVQQALAHFDGQRYGLLAWCIMPNHVHALIETVEGHPVGRVVHSWKSYTANAANRLLQRQGPFWFREYHDRAVRDPRHFAAAIGYILDNPVRAGLVERREDWHFAGVAR